MFVRLQKYIADRGICSRRAAEELIAGGRVEVNGQTVTGQGFKIDDGGPDEVKVDGKIISEVPEYEYYLLNKPRGYVTTAKDQFGRPCVTDFIKTAARVYPVGRLDYDTAGLILLTNDGALAYKLTHPKHGVEKTYSVTIKGALTPDEIRKLSGGVYIDGVKTAPAPVSVVREEDGRQTLKIVLREGRNRQIRKMVESVGHTIVKLRRTAIGTLTANGLAAGEYRALTADEVEYLRDM